MEYNDLLLTYIIYILGQMFLSIFDIRTACTHKITPKAISIIPAIYRGRFIIAITPKLISPIYIILLTLFHYYQL